MSATITIHGKQEKGSSQRKREKAFSEAEGFQKALEKLLANETVNLNLSERIVQEIISSFSSEKDREKRTSVGCNIVGEFELFGEQSLPIAKIRISIDKK